MPNHYPATFMNLKDQDIKIQNIIVEYEPKIKRYIIHLLPGLEENKVYDLLQDILLKIYTNQDILNNKLKEVNFNLNAYIYRTARNHIIDYLRKSKKNKEYSEYTFNAYSIQNLQKEKMEYKFFLSNYDWASPEEDLLQKETYECLYYQINSLKFEYREILFLYYFEKFSLLDISKKLNLNYGAVSMRLQRARYRLKKILETNCCIIINQNPNKIYLSCNIDSSNNFNQKDSNNIKSHNQ